MSPAATSTRRGRGRPAGGGGSTDAILDAALHQFSEHGYARATMRGIAARAQVDPALVSRCFGGKRELFVATVVNRSRAFERLLTALEDDPDVVGRRLVAAYLELWEDPGTQRIMLALARASLEEPDPLGADLLLLAQTTATPELRARHDHVVATYGEVILQVVMSQLFGVCMARHALAAPGASRVGTADLVQLLAPGVQQVLMTGRRSVVPTGSAVTSRP